jgi:peroxiredoxin (alkyl hydroperoxide reductase subunit C)
VKAFSDAFDEFSKLNCQLLAISTDSKYTHLAWNGTGPGAAADNARGLKMPLLADHDHLISRHYGVLQSEGHAQRFVFFKLTIILTNQNFRTFLILVNI